MSGPLRVALADDESMARRRLARLIGELADVELVLLCEGGQQLLDALPSVEVDILLLDIQMPGLDGLQVRAALPEDAPYVVYVTAHPEHALDAFDAGAIDYVLKPVEPERLAQALQRARAFLARAEQPTHAAGLPERIPLEARDGIRLLRPETITHASFDGQLVTLHVAGAAVVTDRSLSELETTLAPHGFERVHRRHLLNLRRVERLEDQPSGGFIAHCDDGARVPVSRQVARQLRRRLLHG